MNTPTIAPDDHHPLGPSIWPAIDGCADYEGEKDIEDLDVESLNAYGEETPAPKVEEAKDAKGRGTAMHEALAKCLRGMPNAFEGLSAAEEAQVRWVAETTIERAASRGYSADEIRVEQRVTMYKGDGLDVLYFGTIDIEYGPFLADAKFGDPRNYFAQVVGYALPKMDRDGLDRIYVELYYGRWKRVIGHTITRETAELVAYALLNKRANPNREPTLCDYCGWCQKRTTCSKTTGAVNMLLSKRLDWAFTLPSMSVSQAGADPVMIGAMKYMWLAFIKPWGEALDYTATVMAEHNNVPLGFTKRPEKGKLAIGCSADLSGARVLKALADAGLPTERVIEEMDFSQSMLARAYMAEHGCGEDKAKRRIEDILTAANLASRGAPTFKLIRNKDAEYDIRAALARPAQTQIT